MPVSRENFTKIDDNTPSPNGDALGKAYKNGKFSFEKIQELYHASSIGFWDLFDFSAYIPSEDTEHTTWINDALMNTAYDTYTCIIIIREGALSEKKMNTLKKKARKLAKYTDDFLELEEVGLFYPEDLEHLMKSPKNMEDRVDLYNFFYKKEAYAESFASYKKEFNASITSLEDFMEIYMHCSDKDMVEKAKIAIETLTGTAL